MSGTNPMAGREEEREFAVVGKTKATHVVAASRGADVNIVRQRWLR